MDKRPAVAAVDPDAFCRETLLHRESEGNGNETRNSHQFWAPPPPSASWWARRRRPSRASDGRDPPSDRLASRAERPPARSSPSRPCQKTRSWDVSCPSRSRTRGLKTNITTNVPSHFVPTLFPLSYPMVGCTAIPLGLVSLSSNSVALVLVSKLATSIVLLPESVQ